MDIDRVRSLHGYATSFTTRHLGWTPPEAQVYILELAARVATLEATVQELSERLRQDSSTSSRPPSSDAPERKRPRRRRPPSGRRPGGQPGHRGQTRTLMPEEDVDEVIRLKPAFCARCDQPLAGADLQPQRHQVVEIPPIRPVVTEYHVHRLSCPCCGEMAQATLPFGVPTGVGGPRAQAIAALVYRQNKRTFFVLPGQICRLRVYGRVSRGGATEMAMGRELRSYFESHFLV